MQTKMFSLVIPSAGVSPHLPEVLEAALQQSSYLTDIVVVCDGVEADT